MKTVALILASLALLACTAESGVDFDKTLTHPNGLVVERPVGFDKVEEDDGGSAGSEYRLWAAKPAGARWIVVSASEQSEDGEPTFALAWALLERARLQ